MLSYWLSGNFPASWLTKQWLLSARNTSARLATLQRILRDLDCLKCRICGTKVVPRVLFSEFLALHSLDPPTPHPLPLPHYLDVEPTMSPFHKWPHLFYADVGALPIQILNPHWLDFRMQLV